MKTTGSRSRVVIIGAAAIAVVAVIVISVLFQRESSPARDADVVPFGGESITPSPLLPTVPPASADVTNCLMSQLRVSDVTRLPSPSDQGPSGVGYRINDINDGANCALGGAPTITVSSPSGGGQPMTGEPPSPDQTGLPPRWVVSAGSSVTVGMSFTGAPCTQFPDSEWQVTIGGPTGATLVTTIPAPGCTQPDSAGDTFRTTEWAPYTPSPTRPAPRPTDNLVVSVSIPKEVQLGTPIEYVATLTNPTSEPISLSPCPEFRQAAGEGAFVSEYYGTLNCESAPSTFEPGTAVSFQMKLELPKQFTTGSQGMISWSLEPDGPGVNSEDQFTVS